MYHYIYWPFKQNELKKHIVHFVKRQVQFWVLLKKAKAEGNSKGGYYQRFSLLCTDTDKLKCVNKEYD